MTENSKRDKLNELLEGGYEFTGKTYKVIMGENKGKEYPVYAIRGDIAGLVYNNIDDKIELVFKLTMPFTGKPTRTSEILKELKNTHSK
jgi:hypothetical protein